MPEDVGNHELQVPLFVVSHQAPLVAPKHDDQLSVTFVTNGIESALAQAIAAAGDDKAVTVVGGVSVIQQLLNAGLVDELHVDVRPVLIGSGLRFFKNIDPACIRLEKVDVQEVGARTSLRFRIARQADGAPAGRASYPAADESVVRISAAAGQAPGSRTGRTPLAVGRSG